MAIDTWRKRYGLRCREKATRDEWPCVDQELESICLKHGWFCKFTDDPHGVFECGPFEMSDDGKPALPDYDRAEVEIIRPWDEVGMFRELYLSLKCPPPSNT